jgi:hypothetical protein
MSAPYGAREYQYYFSEYKPLDLEKLVSGEPSPMVPTTQQWDKYCAG